MDDKAFFGENFKIEDHDWIEGYSENNELYYYNNRTHETQWDRPAGIGEIFINILMIYF